MGRRGNGEGEGIGVDENIRVRGVGSVRYDVKAIPII